MVVQEEDGMVVPITLIALIFQITPMTQIVTMAKVIGAMVTM